jgi:3-oxoacyl-[acyl-carrier protein] reductase
MLAADVAMVVGGGAGIGAATARRFAERGTAVVVVDQVEDRAHACVKDVARLGAQGLAIGGDATSESDVAAAVERTMSSFGRIDALVNCSGGLLTRSNVEDMTLGDWTDAVALNLTSLFLASRAVLPAMKARGSGAIVGISSEYAWGKAGAAHYAAAKAGVLGFVRSLAREVAADGIRVNAVAPGIIGTERILGELTSEAIAARTATIPMDRFGEPSDAADAIVFLAGPASGYITGQVLHVNGGSLTP